MFQAWRIFDKNALYEGNIASISVSICSFHPKHPHSTGTARNRIYMESSKSTKKANDNLIRCKINYSIMLIIIAVKMKVAPLINLIKPAVVYREMKLWTKDTSSTGAEMRLRPKKGRAQLLLQLWSSCNKQCCWSYRIFWVVRKALTVL